jgi:hypothetical protein
MRVAKFAFETSYILDFQIIDKIIYLNTEF